MFGVVTVTTGPTSRLLVALADVKSALGIATADTSQDARLTTLLGVVGRAFSGPYGIDRDPWRQRLTIQLPSRGTATLRFQHFPIERVVTLKDDQAATVTAADYEIAGAWRRDRLRRADSGAWNRSGDLGRHMPDPELIYTADLWAGWLMRAEVPDWVADTVQAVGDFVKSTVASTVLRFEATAVAGDLKTDPTTEPDFASVAVGGTIVDDQVTWTGREAEELPEPIEEAALVTVSDWSDGGLDIPAGIASESGEGWRRVYRSAVTAIPTGAQALLESFR